MSNGIPVFVMKDFREHGIFEDMASMYFTINFKRHQYACGFVLIKLILEVRKAKIDFDWLQTQLAVTETMLKVISEKQ